jgi:phenylpyruvate tautomerase PptA (4-oxalocrotonate tautomerase family)
MPLYTVMTQAGVLNGAAKANLADKLTMFHVEYAGVPMNWVHIIFHEYPIGSGFSAGKVSATVSLTLLIRSGRSAEYKREMLKRLWSLVQSATAAPDEEIVLGIQEVPSNQAMEMGQVMPDVAGPQVATDLGFTPR